MGCVGMFACVAKITPNNNKLSTGMDKDKAVAEVGVRSWLFFLQFKARHHARHSHARMIAPVGWVRYMNGSTRTLVYDAPLGWADFDSTIPVHSGLADIMTA